MDHVNNGEPSDRPTVTLIFLGHDFQYLSVLLNSFLFCFSSRCIQRKTLENCDEI